MVSSEGDDSRESLASLADAGLVCRGEWGSGQESVMPVLDLLKGIVVVVSGDEEG